MTQILAFQMYTAKNCCGKGKIVINDIFIVENGKSLTQLPIGKVRLLSYNLCFF